MEKIGEFVDNFRNNLIVEYNRNSKLKERLVPISKTYHVLCMGDRVMLYYLNKINSLKKSPYVPPHYPKTLDNPLKSSTLPSVHNFSLRNLFLRSLCHLKNIFFNKHSSLKFYAEDFLIPNFCDGGNYTEEGSKDFEIFQMEYKKKDLRDIRKIEYLGDREFLFEALFKEPLMVKVKVIEDKDGIKIDSLNYTKDL